MAILTVLAIILGPVLALSAQRVLDRRREQRERKLQVFRELMATRGARLSYRHVEALNAIQVEFTPKDKSEKRVVDAWNIYLDHLNSTQPTDITPWVSRSDELLTDLLYEISQCLGYGFDKVTLKRGHYAPRGHAEWETDEYTIRKAMVEVLTGKRPIAMTPTPALADSSAGQESPTR